MSAFVVSDIHIHALLNGAMTLHRVRFPDGVFTWRTDIDEPATEQALTVQTAEGIGRMPLAENQRSVNHRYREHDVAPRYTFVPDTYPVDPVRIFKASHCYVHQSYDHPGWGRSSARRFREALDAVAMPGLPARELTRRELSAIPGYDEAPWEISRIADIYPAPAR